MISETVKIIIAIILGIVLGFALGFVLFNKRKLFSGGNNDDVSKDDIDFVEHNTINDETKDRFIKIINKYPHYNNSTMYLYNKILNKEENIYNRNTNRELYEKMIEKNKFNNDTGMLYHLMFGCLQYRSKDYMNDVTSLCELMVQYNSYIPKQNQQHSTHYLYKKIFEHIIYCDISRELYEKIIEKHPYNNDDNKTLYKLIYKHNPKNTYYEFNMNQNTITVVDKYTGTDEEQKVFKENQKSNGIIYITPEDRKLDMLYKLIPGV